MDVEAHEIKFRQDSRITIKKYLIGSSRIEIFVDDVALYFELDAMQTTALKEFLEKKYGL